MAGRFLPKMLVASSWASCVRLASTVAVGTTDALAELNATRCGLRRCGHLLGLLRGGAKPVQKWRGGRRHRHRRRAVPGVGHRRHRIRVAVGGVLQVGAELSPRRSGVSQRFRTGPRMNQRRDHFGRQRREIHDAKDLLPWENAWNTGLTAVKNGLEHWASSPYEIALMESNSRGLNSSGIGMYPAPVKSF